MIAALIRLRLDEVARRAGLDPVAVLSGHADGSLLRRALADSGAERVPRGPSWSSYLQEAASEAARRLLRSLFDEYQPFWTSFGEGLRIVTLAGIGLGLLVLAVVALRLLLRSAKTRANAAAPPVRESGRPGAESGRTRAEWREELERRLDRGDIPAALEALWWWFARSLGEGRVDSSWTSRELLAARRRQDLAPHARALDGMMYGPRPPLPDETRDLLARLEEVLG